MLLSITSRFLVFLFSASVIVKGEKVSKCFNQPTEARKFVASLVFSEFGLFRCEASSHLMRKNKLSFLCLAPTFVAVKSTFPLSFEQHLGLKLVGPQ